MNHTRILVAVGVAAAVVLAGVAAGVAYAYAGDVPRGTTVLGVDIGALSRDEAVVALEAGLAARADDLAAPVTVRIAPVAGGVEQATADQGGAGQGGAGQGGAGQGGAGQGGGPAAGAGEWRDPAGTWPEIRIQPEQVGLAVDVEATVARATRGGGGPLPRLFGGGEIDPVVVVDRARLLEALGDAAAEISEAMTLPEITYQGITPVAVYPEPGLGLDPELTAAAVTDRWLRTDLVSVPLVDIHPVTTAEEVDRLLDHLARPAVAAPVTITLSDGPTLTLSPKAIARSLRLRANDAGEIVPAVNAKKLRTALADQLAEVETPGVDARFTLDGAEPTIVAGSAGRAVDTAALATDLLDVLAVSAPRTVAATMTATEPEVTEQELAGLGVTEQVSTFTTYFDGGLSSPRSQNVVRAAEEVDGALVLPDEVFSLNGHTGPRGYAEGYVDAPIILGGKLVPGVGGGISQFTTTLFNAAYYAGLEDVEHHPHSYYFSRYPAVVESTIFYPTLDMKFRNNTEYGVVIDTSYTEDSITVSMWSTRAYDEVTTEWSARRDVVSPPTRYLEPDPSCIATAGIDGFTQDAWRIFVKDGKEVNREKFTWRYDPEPRFICGEEPGGG